MDASRMGGRGEVDGEVECAFCMGGIEREGIVGGVCAFWWDGEGGKAGVCALCGVRREGVKWGCVCIV